MKTSELTGTALNSAVMSCEGLSKRLFGDINYSGDWSYGGPIIERERIELEHDGFKWWARIKADEDFSGSTPLIAAMRCYVAASWGDDVPAELTKVKP
jgi:hypothetical protein